FGMFSSGKSSKVNSHRCQPVMQVRCGVAQVAFVTALARWRRMVLSLHPCCSASSALVALFATMGTVLLDLF
ncbi:hypothetical protein HMPREF9080_00663, partial [Cardiobacterium valvarum F0432]